MDQLTIFVITYGWQLALIALFGIILLGVLKYANVFTKIEKENRKPIYLAISLGFSTISAVIYLSIVDAFDISYLLAFVTATFSLNQGMYSIYESTGLRDLLKKVFSYLKEKNRQQDILKKVFSYLEKNKKK